MKLNVYFLLNVEYHIQDKEGISKIYEISVYVAGILLVFLWIRVISGYMFPYGELDVRMPLETFEVT